MAYRVEYFEWNDPRRDEALQIRFGVFVDEQKVPAEEEVDATDEVAIHVLLRDGKGTPVGTGRLYEHSPGVGRVGRMAVMREHRGRGAGLLVMKALLQEAVNQGYPRIILHAQTYAAGFYGKCGFQRYGEEEMDCGIPHIMMQASAEDVKRALFSE
jgi:predicted GNAT family N-acyltransferase